MDEINWKELVTKGLLKAFGDKSKKLFLPKTAYTVDNHSYIYLDVNLGLDFKELYLRLLCLSSYNNVIAPVDSIIVIASNRTELTFASCVNEGKHRISGIKFYTEVDNNLKTILKVVVELTGVTDACSVSAYNTEKEEIVIDKITFSNNPPSSYSWQIGYSEDKKIGEVYNNSSDSSASSVTFDIVKDGDEKDSYPAKTEFDTIETSTKTKKLDHDLNFKYDFTHRNDGTSSDSIGDLSSNDLILPIPDLSLSNLNLSTSKEAGSYIVSVAEENSLRTIDITPFPEASLSKLGGIKLYANGDITTTGIYPVKLDNEGRAYIEINNEQEEHPAIIYMGTVDVYSDADKTGGQASLQEKTQEAKLGHLYTCRTNNQEYIRNNITYSDYDNNNWKDCWEYVGEVFKAYTAGEHIAINENRQISTTGLQETLTEGENIHIVGNTISATDTTYEASDFDIKDLTDSTNLRTSWSNKQDAINDLEAIRSGASLGATAIQSIPSEYITESELNEALSEKQDVISDLNTIRSGAELGATALLSFTETDPTVPNWAKLSNKPSYTLDEVTDGTNRKLENTATLKVISNNSGNHITTKENSDKKITFTGGEDKFTVTDGEDSFEIAVTHTDPTIPELLQATAESLGGIKLMDNTPVTVDDKTYYVKLTSGGVAAVNVPWTTNLSTQYLGTVSGSDSLISNPHKGDYYLVSDTWTYNGQSYQPGTQVVYNGATWDIVSTNIAPATNNPLNISSTSVIGTSVKYAREDHKHKISVGTGDNDGQVKVAGLNANVKGLGSAAYKDVPSSGNAYSTQVVLGSDTRLSDSRTPTSHTHGNISNTGTLTDAAAAASGNDYVVLREAGSNKIRTSTIKGTDVKDAIDKKHSHTSLTLSTTALAYDGTNTLQLPSTDPYSSERTPSSHTHGNITNDGKLQTTDHTIASTDKLVVTDSDGLVSRSDVTIDLQGNSTTSIITSSSTDQKLPTSKAVYKAIESALSAVLKYKGTVNGTSKVLPAKHTQGWVYVVETAGIYAGKACEVGDYIICNTSGTTANNSHWDVVNGENQVDNKAATLAFNDGTNQPITIATVDGTDITVTMPSNPNTDTQADWNVTNNTSAAYIKNKPSLATVATSGSYNDLSNKPTIPAALIQSDWTLTDNTKKDYIKNKPTLADVATSGDYSDLTGTPSLATVATSGSYNDLSNKPTIPAALVQSDWNATTGMGVILNKPTIPDAQIQSDWNQTDNTKKDFIKNKPTIPTVPSSLKNPNSLKIGTKGTTNGTATNKITYDGSEEKGLYFSTAAASTTNVQFSVDNNGFVKGTVTDSGNTWRNIKINGTEKLGTGISTGALDIINGNQTTASWNSTNKTVQIDHNTINRTNNTSSETLGYGDTFTAVDSITSDNGHITAVNIKTVTLPSLGTTATTAAKGNHTHTTSLATDSGTSTIDLATNTKYKLTAGGTSVVFKTPTDTNTTYTFAEGSTNGAFQVTPSGGSAQSVAVHGVLTSHQTIKLDGITGATIKRYGTCSTAANTAEKTVSILNGAFSLEEGAKVTVKFSKSNINSNPTLNVASTGAKSIYCDGAAINSNNLNLISGICDFIYDGTNWNLINKFNKVEKVLTETTPSPSIGITNKGYQLLFDSEVFNNGIKVDSSNVGKVAESTKLYFDPGPNSNSSGTLYTNNLNISERIDCEELHALTDIAGNDITCGGTLTVSDGIIASSDLGCNIGDDYGGAFNEIHAATLHLASRGDDDSGHDQSYGGKITFGDGGICYIEESPDDELTIHSNESLTLSTSNDGSIIYLLPAGNIVNVSGRVVASNGFFESSDGRKKNILKEISLEKAYELIDKCQTIFYTFKNDEEKKQHIGVIAQEIEQYYPELVSKDSEEYLSVDYSKLSVILMSVIRDMKSKMSSFEDRLLKLENKLN